jgi:catechol 2,3-dioxygenase-like lactoylglutathione lyase family enzyme
MTLSIKGLDHIVLRSADIDRMIAFYGEVLGCAVERRVDELGLVQMRAGASLIDLVDVNGEIGRAGGPAAGKDAHNMDHFCLRVADFDAAAIAQHLSNHGIDPGEPARRYGADGYGQSIYFQDPDGNTVELKGPPED